MSKKRKKVISSSFKSVSQRKNRLSRENAFKDKAKFMKGGQAVIKVIGVGGGGGNAVTRMITTGDKLRNVEFIAVNTDVQDLNFVQAHKKFYIGRALTKGLGAGMNPEIGKQAAEENRSEIAEALEGADIVFLTAGFGGGTGTGATPVIAEIAREKGILTVAIITKPFTFEGVQRANIAQEGISRLRDKVDSLVVIPNDRIFNIIDKDTSITKAFSFIDEILKNGVAAISELINVPGIINVDLADIKATMKDSGTTLIGIGSASGPERSIKAVQNAINSPLLEVSIDGAKGVLFSIAGGKDMKMTEIHDIAKAIAAIVDVNAKIIFGAYYDRQLADKQIKVTVIATGFNNGFYGNSTLPTPSLFMDQILKTKNTINTLSSLRKERETEEENKDLKNNQSQKTAIKNDESDDETVWDIPAFLRKKKK